MVAPNVLVTNHKTPGASTPLGYMSGGTTFNLLATYASGDEDWTTNPYGGFPCNRGVWFKGVYFFVTATPAGGFRRWRVQAWDPIASTVTDTSADSVFVQSTGSATHTGLYVTNTSNPTLFFFAEGPSQLYYLLKTTDGVTWTTTTVIASPATFFGGLNRAVFYRNQLYVPSRNSSGSACFCIMDPIGATVTTITFATAGFTTGSGQGSVCVFRDAVYLLRINNPTGGVLGLYEFTGGALVLRSTLVSGMDMSATTYLQSDHFLAPIGSTKMVAIGFVDTGNSQATRGLVAFDLTPLTSTTFTATSKTSPMIPTALRRVVDSGTTGVAATSLRPTGFVDNDFNTTPDDPDLYIWLLSDQVAGTYSYYEYVNSDSELTPGSSSLGAVYALPYQTTGGGDRTYATGLLKALVQSIVGSPFLGRMRLQAKVWGDLDPASATTTTSPSRTEMAGRRNNVLAATTTALPSVTAAAQTLTGTANGALTAQDGVTLVLNDDLLVKNQATTAQNGIFRLTQVGDGGTPFILTRRSDANTNNITTGLAGGAWVNVTSGTTLAGTAWYLRISDHAITFNTTALTWSQIQSLDRKFRLWFSATETPNMADITMAGTPTQDFAQNPQVTRNVDMLENVVADGRTIYTFDWNAALDSIQNGQPLNIMARPGVA